MSDSHHFPLPPEDLGHGPVDWSEDDLRRIDRIVGRYPDRKAAVMPVLWLAQDRFGWLSLDVMRLVACTLDLPPSQVLAIATFYTMYRKRPAGRHLLQVCHTLSCELAGCGRIVEHLERRLGPEGSTTEDGLFTWRTVECLASCGSGPVMQVGESTYFERLTPQRVDEILQALRDGELDDLPRPEADRWIHESPAS